MEFEYKVSVIVPVYNAEETLARTMESLFAQTISQGFMEILLIDDGSRDGSPALCDGYAREHFNVHVIHQANAGVSAARNAGIRAAKGKYLLYLDSDDTLSPETVLNVTDFFDQHYDEIDVVVYPNAFCYDSGHKEYHYRNRILTRSGVYDVEKTLYISLTTPNVVVKNHGQRNLFFDETLKFHEDEAYLADMVMLSGKLGYVKEANYWYIQHAQQTTSKYSSPYYIFESSMGLYERLIDTYQVNGVVSMYIQTLILNDLNWKIEQDKLLPRHYTGERMERAARRLSAIANHIREDVIWKHPVMPMVNKYAVLALRNKNRPFVAANSNRVDILGTTGTLARIASIQINVNELRLDDQGLYMLGYLASPVFTFCEDMPRLFAVFNNAARREIPLWDSRFSNRFGPLMLRRCFGFHLSCALAGPDVLHLEVAFRGGRYPVHFWYPEKVSVHPELGCPCLTQGGYGVICSQKEIELLPAEAPKLKEARQSYEKKLWRENKKQWLARRIMEPRSSGRVWLYYDSHDSLDNGYIQFLHDIEKRDGVKRYYVYHGDNEELIKGKFSGKAKRSLVKFGSIRHKRLLAAAQRILTAFIDRTCILPFDRVTYQYYADLFHYQVVYLQHGVMHARLPDMYSKEKVWQVDQVVVSTQFEKENLLKLGYREEDLLTCGMPRLDRLQAGPGAGGERKILFAPSWRCSLVATRNGAQTPVEAFYSSTYYREFSAFLKDERLHAFLEKHDLYLDVQIHPMFSCYRGCFLPAGSTRVRETRFANVGEYLACITDFSSFMFDFIYLDRPVISYFPDREEFQSGSHSYNDFYYPIEDGFALYCEDKEGALSALEGLAADNFALPPKLAQRAKGLYYSREADHMERLYTMLMGDE